MKDLESIKNTKKLIQPDTVTAMNVRDKKSELAIAIRFQARYNYTWYYTGYTLITEERI